jgi:tRNA(Arg) A34 adenosine deaminase TadA
MEGHVQRAIELSKSAMHHGNHPFGALLVDEESGTVLLEAENTVITESDATGHAETNLVRMACKQLTKDQLTKCTLVTSTEPCCMCAGAIFWSGIQKVVYACSCETLSQVTSSTGKQLKDGGLHIPCREVFKRAVGVEIAVTGPILEEQAKQVHDQYWPNL